MRTPPDAAQLSRALDILAQLIARDGPVYVPLFERLERELQARQTESDTLSRALARAAAKRPAA